MKTPKPATRVSLGLKVTADLKNQLDSAARASGRTQSQEAEKRLEQSFRDQALLNQVLELAYGNRLGGLLLLIGQAMSDAGRFSAFTATRRLKDVENWLDNAYGYDQAMRAAHRVLDVLRPKGDTSPPNFQPAEVVGSNEDFSSGELLDITRKYMGDAVATGLLLLLQGRAGRGELKDWADPVIEMLGPMVDRMNWRETKNER